jgi:NAD-dependent dihydropyrimidine dehydrogenase PreA subunit
VTFVIGASCVDIMDQACVDECPADCIYVGGRMAYINPEECIDCGACEPVCPVEAITKEEEVAPDQTAFIAENARFFTDFLPGRSEPVGSPGGAARLGPIGVDTPFIHDYCAP